MKSNAFNPIASVTSGPTAQSGEDHRSSGNFSTEGAPSGTKNVQFVITDNPNADKITFNVMQDVSVGSDSTIWQSVANNEVVKYAASRSYYIADPENAGNQSFTVQIWPAD
jgi:hypothetical protein